jgi:hypothetical protein
VSITAFSEGINLVARVTLDGDEGYFDAADAGDNALYLKPSVPAIVGRWRSSEGNRYQLTSDSEKLIVGLKEAEFKSALVNFGNHPRRHWCEMERWLSTWQEFSQNDTEKRCRSRTCSDVQEKGSACQLTCEPNSKEEKCNHLPVLTWEQEVGGESYTTFTPSYTTSDADVGAQLETYWTAEGECEGDFRINTWLAVPKAPTITRSKKSGDCKVVGRVRDKDDEGNSVAITGKVYKGCSNVIFLSLNGLSPEAYAKTCAPPNYFAVLVSCNPTGVEKCTGEATWATLSLGCWGTGGRGLNREWKEICFVPSRGKRESSITFAAGDKRSIANGSSFFQYPDWWEVSYALTGTGSAVGATCDGDSANPCVVRIQKPLRGSSLKVVVTVTYIPHKNNPDEEATREYGSTAIFR